MKKEIRILKQATNDSRVFSRFSENDILSLKSMNCIRGGDGGEDIWVDPPPPPPKP